MKQALRTLFRPILSRFETGDEDFVYKPSHRLILKVMGGIFLLLAIVSMVSGVMLSQLAAALPALVFSGITLVCMVVGFLGNDRAVAKIWRSGR